MKILIAGASGETGKKILPLLLKDPEITEITALLRNKLAKEESKLEMLQIDFDRLDALEPIAADIAICALGSTIGKAGSKEAFRKVDYHYVLAFAQWAKRSGVKYFHFISAMGANSRSDIFYNRVKGEAEEALKALSFDHLYIYRPSLIDSERKENRPGEKLGIFMMRLLNPLFIGPLKSYRSIKVERLAKGIYKRLYKVSTGEGFIIPSDKI